jgi:DNA-binding PadR family transcriptional regulator
MADKLSLTQYRLLTHLRDFGKSTLLATRPTTVATLLRRGLIEGFVPEATTFTEAVRGRVRYYRLTDKGRRAYSAQRKRDIQS